MFSPGFSIKQQAYLTVQIENVHAVSHFKHPTCTLLEYAKNVANSMKEPLKRSTKWSAYYFSHANPNYPVPQTKISLRDVPKIGPKFHAPVSQQAWQSCKTALGSSEQHQACKRNSSSEYVQERVTWRPSHRITQFS